VGVDRERAKKSARGIEQRRWIGMQHNGEGSGGLRTTVTGDFDVRV
jgi:hypothetical protein